MNDLVVQNVVVIPVVLRHAVFATANSIRGFDFSLFSAPLWRLLYWSEDALTGEAQKPCDPGPSLLTVFRVVHEVND